MQIEATLPCDGVHIESFLRHAWKYRHYKDLERKVLDSRADRIWHDDLATCANCILTDSAIGTNRWALGTSPPIFLCICPPIRKDADTIVANDVAVIKDGSGGAHEEHSDPAAIARRGDLPPKN